MTSMIDYEDTFESSSSGASLTYPSTAGEVKKGSFMCIKDRPCKIVDYSCHKTGKHGHAKATIVGIDIFNTKKLEDSLPAASNVEIPNISRKEYALYTVEEDNYCSLMDLNTNEMRSDIKLPEETESDTNLTKKVKAQLEEGKEINITLLISMGMEKIIDFKEI